MRTEFADITDSLLKANQLLVLALSEDSYLPVRIRRVQISAMYYNFLNNISGFLPLGPTTLTTPPAGTQSFFADSIQLGIKSIQNAQDVFKISRSGEILQIFYGISPSTVRVMIRQPLQSYIFNLDTETATIIPQPSFIEMGIDGFESPLKRPQPETETFIVGGMGTRVTMMNMSPLPASPSMNFIINRLQVEPIADAALIKAIIEGRTPAKIADIGAIDGDVTNQVNYSQYGVKGALTREQIQSPNFASILKGAGY